MNQQRQSSYDEIQQIQASIVWLCTQTDGTRGIWKRIDECRELYDCLQEYAPGLMIRAPWIEEWLAYQYAFLNALQQIMRLPENPAGMSGFPAPWAGKDFTGQMVKEMAAQLVTVSRESAEKTPLQRYVVHLGV